MSDLLTQFSDLAALLWPVVLGAALAVVAERLLPNGARPRLDGLRWLHSGTIYLLGALLVRLVLPVTALGAAISAARDGFGLFVMLDAPLWLALPLSILALDLGNYARHRLHHTTEAFWRLHRLHHSDREIDTTTALRFHPFEIAMAALIDIAVVAALGVPPAAVVAFFFIVLAFDLWEHAAIDTPRWTRALLPVLVTPEMHRIHHGDDPAQYNANFGIVFSIWDRLFGTFCHPASLEQDPRYGLGADSRLRFDTISRLLADPFRRE